MPKKKKTLKQKQATDQRRSVGSVSAHTATSVSPSNETKTSSEAAPGLSFSLPEHYTKTKYHPVPSAKVTTATITTDEYAYLGRDLTKTLILTVAIIVAELVIHFFTNS